MRRLFAAAAGTLAAIVLMIAPTATASASPGSVGTHGGATVACTYCNIGF